MDFAGRPVDDFGRGAEKTPIEMHRALADDDALDHLGARADEAVVLDDRRVRLQRLEHAADADAAREMHVLADLGAAPDRHPGVHHRARVDVGAEIDEGRHQHGARRHVGRAPYDRARHGAEPGLAEIDRAPSGEFRRHLVPPAAVAGPARDQRHRVKAEREQHRLLEPLIDHPCAARLLGDAHGAAVEERQRVLDRVANRTGSILVDGIANVERRLDDRLQVGQFRRGHRIRSGSPKSGYRLSTMVGSEPPPQVKQHESQPCSPS